MSFSTAPIKAVADLNPETLGEDTPADAEYSYAEISDVAYGLPIQWQEPRPFEQLPSRARRLARDGDIVVSTVRTYLRAVARVEDSPDNAVASTGFAVLRPKAVESRYLGYALLSADFVEAVVAQSVGVSYPAINASDVARIHLPLPTPTEQRQIADYLDHETAEIDAFIADLSILKAFTAERHRSLQRALFTPDGAISMPIKRVSRLVSGSGFPPDSQGQAGKELPFFKVSSFAGAHDGVLADSRDTISPREAAALSATVLPSGSVVMAKIGAALFLGRTARLARAACIDNNLVALVPNRFVLPEYLQHAVQTVDLAPLANPGAVPSLNMQWFRDSRVRVPDLKTQALILEDFERASMIISDELADIDAAIALAKERRAALITAAVTGQIDVSGFGTRAARATQPPGVSAVRATQPAGVSAARATQPAGVSAVRATQRAGSASIQTAIDESR